MIRIPEIRVIDEEGEQLGVMATQEAMRLAEERGLDLVEVSPTARPPVCRIMDFGKYKYERNKKLKESKKKQHIVQVKEIKLRPKTEEHDYQFKKRHAEDFLKKGNKVKFTVIFRGRELDHRELGFKILKRAEEDLVEIGEVERPARFEGRLMIMYMKPLPLKPEPKKQKKPEPEAKTPQVEQEPGKQEQPQQEKQTAPEESKKEATATQANEEEKDAENQE
jgi:translation initiation factor IF-3